MAELKKESDTLKTEKEALEEQKTAMEESKVELIMSFKSYYSWELRGHLAVPKSFIIAFSYSSTYQLWGLKLNFDWLIP